MGTVGMRCGTLGTLGVDKWMEVFSTLSREHEDEKVERLKEMLK